MVRQKEFSYYENGLENDHVSITTHLDARTQQNGTTIKNKMVVVPQKTYYSRQYQLNKSRV